MVKQKQISILIGGEAGAGISAAGFTLAKVFMRGNLRVFGTVDYPSLIRGGHNFYMIRASTKPVYSQWDFFDLIIALDENTIRRHHDELAPEGGVIYDSDEIPSDNPHLPIDTKFVFPIPIKSIVKELKGPKVVRNTVALGATLGILGYNIELLEEIVLEFFATKGDKIIDMNVQAARQGFEFAQKNFAGQFSLHFESPKITQKDQILLTGNEAVALGAIAAGCKFYSAYPMTPASPVLHFLMTQAERLNMVVIQPESEIAAINMAIGAAYAGVRAMTGTSGGGFCLMTEAFGLAGMTETPLVVMLGQRTGPSTGLPTYTGQSDLRFAVHASQGEFPRIVVAPGDVEECYEHTIDAFNLAEEFQIPAIILTDKHLLESHASTKPFTIENIPIKRGKLLPMTPYTANDPYKRHQFTDDGVSPRLIPGTPGALTHTDSAVHKESGFQGDDCSIATRMADKRYRKLPQLQKALTHQQLIKIHGRTDAKISLVGWGSTKGAALEALRLLEKDKIMANFIQVIFLSPFPSEAVSKVLKGKIPILIEGNQTAQLGSLIKEYTGLEIPHKILRYDGRPFNPLQLARRIKEVL